MSEKDDEIVVICGPLWTATVQGSKIFKCTKCGKEVACSPIGQKMINEQNGKPYCPTCAAERIRAMEQPPEIIDPTEAIKLAAEHINSQGKN